MSTPLSKTSSKSAVPVVEPLDLTLHNTFGLRSHARACVTLDRASQVSALHDLVLTHGAMLVLGGGSNVVLPEAVGGIVVRPAFKGITLVGEDNGHWIVEAGAGENWHALVAYCVAQGWFGLENLALIPGNVGAAPVQNIGAYGIELVDRLHSVIAWDMQAQALVTLLAKECGLAYRDSRFKHDAAGRWVILAVRFRLPQIWQPMLDYPDLHALKTARLAADEPVDAKAVFDAVCDIRRAKLPDPAKIGNAGSFFKNPWVSDETYRALAEKFPGLVAYRQTDGRYKLAAGWLIDQCGWKGRDLGAAGVHDRQALVLVNRGGASARDILALARAIQDDVQARYGVMLEPEPVVVPSA